MEKKSSRVLKYRTIAEIYPHRSFEAEVALGDMNVYINFDVANGERVDLEELMLSDTVWAYTVPITEVNFESDDEEVSLTEEEYRAVLGEMAEIWNRSPVFVNSSKWKHVQE